MKKASIQIITSGIGLSFSIAVILLANTGEYFGKVLNYIIKCNGNPEASFPCYGIYDIWIMTIFSAIGIYFLIKILHSAYKIYTGN